MVVRSGLDAAGEEDEADRQAGGPEDELLDRVEGHHWNAETMKQHEAMGFHDGWDKAADQLAALARTL